MSQRIQSVRWLSLLRKVLEHCQNDVSLSPATNDETFKRAMGWLEKLMKGDPLSPKQATNFIDSIQKRVPGKSDFTWSGPIVLTAKQIMDEKKENRLGTFRALNRHLTYASKLMLEAVEEKLSEVDFTDIEVLAQLKAHIMAFTPVTSSDDQSVPNPTE